MLKTVTLAQDPFDPSSWTRHEVPDIREFLMESFPQWPAGARIYHEQVALCCDVTPADERGIEKLGELAGPFYVVVYPGTGIEVAAIVLAVVAVAASVATYFLLRPSTPSQTPPGAAANSLSNRSNSERINGRIPDIFGQVRAIPDLVAVPYRVYEGNTEVEYCYMCLGRGSYEIDVPSIREGTTPITDIDANTVLIYDPNTSPNSGTPIISLPPGRTLPEPVLNVKRISGVNGQQLKPPNLTFWNANPSDMQVGNDGVDIDGRHIHWIGLAFGSAQDFTDYFVKGQSIDVALTTGGVNLAGTYVIASVTPRYIYLVDAQSVNEDWWMIYTTNPVNTGGPGGYIKGADAGGNWVGPFFVDVPDATRVFVNLLAPQGLYRNDNEAEPPQSQWNTVIQVEITPTDATGAPTDTPNVTEVFLNGSAGTKIERALTAKIATGGYCTVRARLATLRDHPYNYQRYSYEDTIKWADLYAVAPVPQEHFGDVTTVYSVTRATRDARRMNERKLNMLATRKIPTRYYDTSFSEPQPTIRADDIIVAICTDPFIGRRVLPDGVTPDYSQLDLDNIYSTIAEVETYFPGGSKCVQFCYTFDQDNVSFEESLAQVAMAVFCLAYRRGSQIRLSFEKETQDSVLLFNHRNKVPGTETRTVRFGNQDAIDGVEFSYVSPVDDAPVKYYIPEDLSARNPKKVDSIGVRSRVQAYYQAWRIWNKIRYQNIAVEFEATQEADLLVLLDRILVADNTRAGTQDGEVTAQDGLELTLSRPVTL